MGVGGRDCGHLPPFDPLLDTLGSVADRRVAPPRHRFNLTQTERLLRRPLLQRKRCQLHRWRGRRSSSARQVWQGRGRRLARRLRLGKQEADLSGSHAEAGSAHEANDRSWLIILAVDLEVGGGWWVGMRVVRGDARGGFGRRVGAWLRAWLGGFGFGLEAWIVGLAARCGWWSLVPASSLAPGGSIRTWLRAARSQSCRKARQAHALQSALCTEGGITMSALSPLAAGAFSTSASTPIISAARARGQGARQGGWARGGGCENLARGPSVQIWRVRIHGSDPRIRSTDQIHGSDPAVRVQRRARMQWSP